MAARQSTRCSMRWRSPGFLWGTDETSTGRIEVIGTRVRLSGPAERRARADRRDAGAMGGLDGAVSGGDRAGRTGDAARCRAGAVRLAGCGRLGAGLGGRRRPRQLEIAAEAQPTAEQRALLDLPWEVLADAIGHLAADAVQPFEVWRRVGPAGEPAEPQHRDLSLLFMAASPRGGGPELDYEAEEAAILARPSGCRWRCRSRRAAAPSSCASGSTARRPSRRSTSPAMARCSTPRRRRQLKAEAGPVLLLETPQGTAAPSLAGTAGAGLGRDATGTGVPLGLPHRGEPGGHGGVLRAHAGAGGAGGAGLGRLGLRPRRHRLRRGVLPRAGRAGRPRPSRRRRRGGRCSSAHQRDPQTGRALAPGAALARGGRRRAALRHGQAEKRKLPEQDAGYKALLDRKRGHGPEWRGPLTFVGRRREAQAVLAAFREDEAPGVLVLGMGNLGKSSLAARVANRLRRSRRWWSTGTTTRSRCWSRSAAPSPPDCDAGSCRPARSHGAGDRAAPRRWREALEALLRGAVLRRTRSCWWSTISSRCWRSRRRRR